ncbi:C2H2-type zinc-finger protein [Rhizoctonia solani AG-3 Rhs1AP]|uniref:C2H2-type zinc-finger protein n=2 Tax=Rhizoctonia solani AG-3 TaxID=1086053 RepID=A0A074RQ01_9AGAM|nr:C2H2-type zinc-finger protein [Rhizoctonia solani AG-3 Rhs1AP]KEP48949.1 C2H2-type zinc-finger protein [Rhizoctonia solani 123E]
MSNAHQSSLGSSFTSATTSSCTTPAQEAGTCKPRFRSLTRFEVLDDKPSRRQSNSCTGGANVDKLLDNRILKPFLRLGSRATIQSGCLEFIKLLWTVYHFTYCAVQCVYRVVITIFERPEISRFMPVRRDSGRAKGLNPEDINQIENTYSHRAPSSRGGAEVQGRMSRSRPRRAHNGDPSSYMLPEDPYGSAGDPLWVAPGMSYDPYTSQVYNSALIETMSGNIDSQFTYDPYHDTTNWDLRNRSSIPSLSNDQFQRGHPSSGPHPSTSHGARLGGLHPTTFPNRDPLDHGIIPSIDHYSSDAFMLNPDSSTYHPESYLPDLSAPLAAPIPPARLHLDSSVKSFGSDPVSPGGTRRTRRQNICEICGKEVRRPGVLDDHMNSHTGHRPHECSHCPRVFTTKSNMQRHITNFHGGGLGK